MENSVITIATILISIFLHGWFLWYFTYFKKKGEYQAMKEEIEGITHLTEKIKADLSRLSQKQMSLDNEIRNAIIQYNDVVSQCVDGTLLSVFTKSTVDITKNYFSETFAKYSLAQSRLSLFIQDDEIERISSQIGVHIFKIAQFNINTVSAFEKMVNEKASQEEQIEYIKKYANDLVSIATPIQSLRRELIVKFKRYFE